MTIELLQLLRLAIILGQMVYWWLLRDDERDVIVWRACLYPGRSQDMPQDAIGADFPYFGGDGHAN